MSAKRNTFQSRHEFRWAPENSKRLQLALRFRQLARLGRLIPIGDMYQPGTGDARPLLTMSDM